MKLNFLPNRQFALQLALASSGSLQNTGNRQDRVLGKTKMFFAAPPTLAIPSGTTDIVTWAKSQIHAAASARIYPFFGNNFPIWDVTNNDAQDITETSQYTGQQAFISAGAKNRTFQTTSGGFPLAQAFTSFRNSGYAFMEVDASGAYMLVLNTDGSYSFIPVLQLGGASPQPASGTAQYKNQFTLAFDPDVYVTGRLFQPALGLLSLKGLQDVDVYTDAGSTASTTTQIYVKVRTTADQADLVALLGSTLSQIANFVVTDVTAGAPITPSAIAIINGQIRLTGTFPSGHVINIALAAASALFANSMFYYEGKNIATVSIP